jgi:hypothetical protein
VDNLADADMIGHLMRCRLTGNQPNAIRNEPWYAGRPVAARQPILFCTGGWWAARTDWIRKYDWPIASLEHRGGDVLTGVLHYQQQLRLRNSHEHVCISAADSGKVNSCPRRGHDQKPWGYYVSKTV